jgi:hypothetical protein
MAPITEIVDVAHDSDRLSFDELVQVIRCAHARETVALRAENVALKRRLQMAKADLRSPGCDAA